MIKFKITVSIMLCLLVVDGILMYINYRYSEKIIRLTKDAHNCHMLMDEAVSPPDPYFDQRPGRSTL